MFHSMECILCKIQYIVKSGNPFNLKLHNRWKDINNPKVNQACNDFEKPGQNFKKHEKFATIKSTVSKDAVRLRLKMSDFPLGNSKRLFQRD